jgi:hypothetical protein
VCARRHCTACSAAGVTLITAHAPAAATLLTRTFGRGRKHIRGDGLSPFKAVLIQIARLGHPVPAAFSWIAGSQVVSIPG